MKLVSIFADPKPAIYAIQFDDEDEFTKVFDLWSDVEYLEDFFEKNKSDLEKEFYGNISVEEAVNLTLKEAELLEERLYELAQNGNFDTSINLQSLFKALNNQDYKITSLQKSKAYGSRRKSWLRIYAIRIASNLYVITGGAIKLTQTMNERSHTLQELNKLCRVKDFLKEEGLLDESDFENLEIDI